MAQDTLEIVVGFGSFVFCGITAVLLSVNFPGYAISENKPILQREEEKLFGFPIDSLSKAFLLAHGLLGRIAVVLCIVGAHHIFKDFGVI